MKKRRRYAVILMLAFLSLCGGHSLSRVSGQMTGNNVIEDQTPDEDVLVAGRNVQIRTEMPGDVTAAGSDVTLSSPVAGYAMVAASNININGSIGNDLWAAGANVNLNAPVADNAMLAGSDVTLLPGADVRNNVKIAAGNASVQGRIERNLKLAAGNAEISSEIGGSVDARIGSLKLLPGAVVRGNLVVYGPREPEISPQAQVLGAVQFHKQEPQRAGIGDWLLRWLWVFLAMTIVGFVALAVAPLSATRVSSTIRERPWLSILTGLVLLLLVPIIVVLLLVTVVGIPLALVLFALYVAALVLSGIFVAYLVGGWLLGRLQRPAASPYWRMAVGVLAVAFVVALPWIGWLAQLLILMIGLGALILDRREFLLQVRRQGINGEARG